MKIFKKHIVWGFLSIALFLIGFIALGLYAMTIEDHYGDLQDFFYKSKTGDLMVLGDFEKVGLVHKTWKRIGVVNSNKDTVDLYNWVSDKNYPNKSIELYRFKQQVELEALDRESLNQKVKYHKIKKIFSMVKPDYFD